MEVVIFQRTDVVVGVTAHYGGLCTARKGCVQQWTKVLQGAGVKAVGGGGGREARGNKIAGKVIGCKICVLIFSTEVPGSIPGATRFSE